MVDYLTKPPESFSFEIIMKFGQDSQNVIDSLPRFVLNDVVSFPLISLYLLQNKKFNINKNYSFDILIRKSYFDLISDFEATNFSKYNGIYLTGPIGVGKSFLLYSLAVNYRKNRSEYRVSYINDCSVWTRNELKYFLNELVTTFIPFSKMDYHFLLLNYAMRFFQVIMKKKWCSTMNLNPIIEIIE